MDNFNENPKGSPVSDNPEPNLKYTMIQVIENNFGGVIIDACPYCGSIAVVHFDDGFHRCLRNARHIWDFCHLTSGKNVEDRIIYRG